MVEDAIPLHALVHSAACCAEVGGFDRALEIGEGWDFLIRLSARHRFVRVHRPTSESRLRVAGPEELLGWTEREMSSIGLLHARYPAGSPEVEDHRAALLDRLRSRSDELRRMRDASPGGDRAALLASCRVHGFRPAGT
jgi:hypothetical protein